MGGTIAFISGPEMVSDGKLAANMAAEVETMGASFVTDTGKISEASVAEGAGDKAEDEGDRADGAGGKADGAGAKAEGAGGKLDGGKEADVILGILALAGSKDDGNSGKLEDTVGKGGVKLGYCIGCCIDEGIDKPGGG